jgi:hypothetical protein
VEFHNVVPKLWFGVEEEFEFIDEGFDDLREVGLKGCRKVFLLVDEYDGVKDRFDGDEAVGDKQLIDEFLGD